MGNRDWGVKKFMAVTVLLHSLQNDSGIVLLIVVCHK